MDIHLQSKNIFFSGALRLTSVFIICFCTLFCLSCSNNVPQVHNAKLNIIFDYDSMESLPNVRMGIFVEATSNPRRFEKITVAPKGKDYSWEVTDLLLAESHEQKYSGAVNLVMPKDEQFPTGEYQIEYIQSDEETSDIKIGLFYDKKLYELKGSDVAQYMTNAMGSKMIKIYDENKKIIYYGPRTVELRDARNIWNNYREAAEFQETWVNGSVICNMPIEKVEPGN